MRKKIKVTSFLWSHNAAQRGCFQTSVHGLQTKERSGSWNVVVVVVLKEEEKEEEEEAGGVVVVVVVTVGITIIVIVAAVAV